MEMFVRNGWQSPRFEELYDAVRVIPTDFYDIGMIFTSGAISTMARC